MKKFDGLHEARGYATSQQTARLLVSMKVQAWTCWPQLYYTITPTKGCNLRRAAVPQLLHSKGLYKPAAHLPPKVVKKLLLLEFLEIAKLWADM